MCLKQIAERRTLSVIDKVMIEHRDNWNKLHPNMEYYGMTAEDITKEVNNKMSWLEKLFCFSFLDKYDNK